MIFQLNADKMALIEASCKANDMDARAFIARLKTVMVLLKTHPAANLFQFHAEVIPHLMARVRKYGPTIIWVDAQQRVIDGRHQWVTCRMLNIVPVTKEFTGDSPADFSLRFIGEGRRHCTPQDLQVAAAQEMPTAPVAILPAAFRERTFPPSAITPTAPSGRNRQIQAVVISVIWRPG